MSPWFYMFLATLISLVLLSFWFIKKGPYWFLINGLLIAFLGVLFGFNVQELGFAFNDISGKFFGNAIVVLTSAISGGVISSAYAEIRQRHINKNYKA